jgi:hypothetical protein
MRLAHLLLQHPHNMAMWERANKLLERRFTFQHRQSPKLLLKDIRQQRVAKKPRCVSQLTGDALCVEQEHAQIAKALQREDCQQNEIIPLKLWLAQGCPWRRRHRTYSIDVAAWPGTVGIDRRPLVLHSQVI